MALRSRAPTAALSSLRNVTYSSLASGRVTPPAALRSCTAAGRVRAAGAFWRGHAGCASPPASGDGQGASGSSAKAWQDREGLFANDGSPLQTLDIPQDDRDLHTLLEANRKWSENMSRHDPEFFSKTLAGQEPKLFWIGCCDSRVPANEIMGLLPGEVFVHRNIANIVPHSDLNSLSATQFAVDVLKIPNIVVCGHLGCAGVKTALVGGRAGIVDNWLRHVADVRDKHRSLLNTLPGEGPQADMLVRLNVIEQVMNVANTTVVRDAWGRGQNLRVHGWCYSLADGRLQTVLAASSLEEAEESFEKAISDLSS